MEGARALSGSARKAELGANIGQGWCTEVPLLGPAVAFGARHASFGVRPAYARREPGMEAKSRGLYAGLRWRTACEGPAMSEFLHLAARAYHAPMPLSSHAIACWLWPHLRKAFPKALAVVLMPDHLHVVLQVSEPSKARAELALALGNCARARGPVAEVGWAPNRRVVPGERPSAFSGSEKLARNVRYVALNPVRAGLVEDPLAWPWSTHRDVLGCVTDPWVTPKRLASALGWPPLRVAREWHTYVALDAGKVASALPVSFAHQPELPFGEVPLSWIAAAAAAATRAQPGQVQARGATRALFLALAKSAGWPWSSAVAARCGISSRGVRRAWSKNAPRSLAAGLLCLGDARLRGER